VRWKTCDEYLLYYVEGNPAGRRNKGLVGVHVDSKVVAFLHEFVDGLL
jgi:hypothetical protein